MTPAQLSLAAGADAKWIRNARHLLGRPASDDVREARWLGLVHTLHSTLGCALRVAARVADAALAAPLGQRELRVPLDELEGRAELVIDLWRDRTVHAARLSRALMRPDPERRGRKPVVRWSRVSARVRALASGIDIRQLRAGLLRPPAERVARHEPRLTGLEKAGVRFVVVGDVAGALHGSERVTNGLDVVYDATDPTTVDALARLLAEWDAYPRGVERGLPFIMDARTLRAAPILTLTSREGDLDVLDRIDGVGEYAKVAAHSERVEVFGVAFHVLDLPTLIRARRVTGRPEDREVLLELEVLLQERTLRGTRVRARGTPAPSPRPASAERSSSRRGRPATRRPPRD